MKILLFFVLLLAAPWLQAANYVCGQDLNFDGYVDAKNETASCVVSAVGQVCPIGKVACKSESKKEYFDYIFYCPAGTTEEAGRCKSVSNNATCDGSHAGPFTNLSENIPSGTSVDRNSPYSFWSSHGSTINIVRVNGTEIKVNFGSLPQYQVVANFCYKRGAQFHSNGSHRFYTLYRAPMTSVTYVDKSKKCPEIPNRPIFDDGTRCSADIYFDVCPLDSNSACVQDGSKSYCSPNKCVDLDVDQEITQGEFDDTMLVDDGARDDSGACLDQLYIFNGKASECRPPGASTAFKNCCSDKGSALQDGAGSVYSVYGGLTTVKKMYQIGKVAYNSYQAAIAIGETAQAASQFAASSAQIQAGLMFNPTTLAIGVAVHFAMEYLMQACEQTDLDAAMLNSSGYCYEVGEYCKKKWPMIGCVQKARSFCCFNSKLARIIHEQGRPQLKTFGSWGTPEAPLCRGFKPEEFQSLDFSRIDLSEYVEDLVHKTQSEMADTIKKVSSEFYEQTISK